MHFHQMKTKNIKVHYLNVDYVVTVRTDKINGGKGSIRNTFGDFPGGAVDRNPPANAKDMGSIPGLGRLHMPWSS